MATYRSVFISDIHLGTRGCQAPLLLDFLRSMQCEYLYLVGDIVDGWRLKKSWHWPQTHNDVLQEILKDAQKGTKVIYTPGNHDEGFREFVGLEFGRVNIQEDAIHETADGKKILVLHGDQFDLVVNNVKWLAFIGDYAYRFLLGLNTVFNFVRRKLGFPYWSLSAYLKHKVKNAVEYIGHYEATLTEEARYRGVDAILCGHIHHAQIRDINGITYMNCGDWVESCTAIVEHTDGKMEILYWAKRELVTVEPKPRRFRRKKKT